MRAIGYVLITALALLITAWILDGIIVEGLYPAIIAAAILGLLNLIVRPILVILTLPITLVTLGLFMFVINAGILWFVSSFVEGFYVDGFWYAVGGSIMVSIISAIGNWFIYKND